MDGRIDYTALYLSHNINFRDIPLNSLNEEILRKAAVWDKKDYIDRVFELYEIDNSIDLLSFASLVSEDSIEYFNMYERIFEVDPIRYFDFIPNKCRNINMWNKMVEIDAEKYFPLVPAHCISSSMYEILLRKDFDRYIDLILVKNVKPKLCKYIYQVNPEKLFKFVGLRYFDNLYCMDLLTEEMCLKLVEIDLERFFRDANYFYIDMVFDTDPLKYYDIIPLEKRDSHVYEKMFSIDPVKYFLDVPMVHRNANMCNMMFEIDPEKYFLEFPLHRRTDFMCERMFQINPEMYFIHIPHNLRNKSMCNKMFEIDEEKYFYLIPRELRTKEMCYKMAELNIRKYFMDIPHQYRTIDLWVKKFEADPYFVLNELPLKFRTKEVFLEFYKINSKIAFEGMIDEWKTQEMCDEYFKFNKNSFERFVPREYYNKEMYKVLIRKDLVRYSRIMPDNMIDEEMIGIAKIEMKNMIMNLDFVKENKLTKLMLIVIELYPECREIIYKVRPVYTELELNIKNELYSLINSHGTIESITENYGVSVSMVNTVLEKIKIDDVASYEAIKDVLDMNQRGYFFNMMRDVSNLSMIINMIGNVDIKGMTLEQKLMFSYLCNKHITNSLEEIYSFNFKKYTNIDYSNVTRFFNRVLKYNFIHIDGATIPEKKTIQFNNGWLRKYDTKRFFAIKNGVPTMERRYGKDSQLLTLEIEEKIINVLKSEGIKLSEVIVTTAFREYFNGNLAMYVEKLKGYDAMYLDVKKNSVGRGK